jgi:hypothetical protein
MAFRAGRDRQFSAGADVARLAEVLRMGRKRCGGEDHGCDKCAIKHADASPDDLNRSREIAFRSL